MEAWVLNKLRWTSYIIYTVHVHVVLVSFFLKPLRPRGWTVSRQRRFHLPFAALRQDFRWPPGSVHQRPPRGSTSHLQLLRMDWQKIWMDEFASKTEVLLIYEWSSGKPYCDFIVLHSKFRLEKTVLTGYSSGLHLINPGGQFILEDQPFDIQPACFWKLDHNSWHSKQAQFERCSLLHDLQPWPNAGPVQPWGNKVGSVSPSITATHSPQKILSRPIHIEKTLERIRIEL